MLCKYINFDIVTLHIGYGNSPGLFMTFVYIDLKILVLIFVHNISLEYNLKQSLQIEYVLATTYNYNYNTYGPINVNQDNKSTKADLVLQENRSRKKAKAFSRTWKDLS